MQPICNNNLVETSLIEQLSIKDINTIEEYKTNSIENNTEIQKLMKSEQEFMKYVKSKV